nr:PEPxxWA-CTERM sorting domain-containing protein [Sphingobium sp. SYK-6]
MKKLFLATLLIGSAMPAQALTTYRYDFAWGTGSSYYYVPELGYVDTPGWFSATMKLSITDEGFIWCSMWSGSAICEIGPSGFIVEYENYQTMFRFEARFDPFVGRLPTSSEGFRYATLSGYYPFRGYWADFKHVTVSVYQEDEEPSDTFRFSFHPGIPEPATWAMMIGGFALAGGALRRRGMAARVRGVQFA